MSRGPAANSMSTRVFAYLQKHAGKTLTADQIGQATKIDPKYVASQISRSVLSGSDGGAILRPAKGTYIWQAGHPSKNGNASNAQVKGTDSVPRITAKRETFTVVHESRNGVLIASSKGGVYLLGDKVMD